MKSYINDLMKMGLTEYEARAYFTLLKKKNFTGSEVSKLANIPRTKVYAVLGSLVQKGKCTEIPGMIKKFKSVSPEFAFNNLIIDLEDKRRLIANVTKSLMPLYDSKKENSDPLDYIEVVRGKEMIAQKYISLMKTMKEELLIFTKAPYAINIKNNEEGINLIKRGVKVKSIYEVDDARKQDFLKWVEIFADAGENVKIAYELPLKLAIFDEKKILCVLRDRIPSTQELTALTIEHPDLANAFKIIFYTCWEKAITLREFKIKLKESVSIR